MISFHKLVAAVLGIGYIQKGGGSVAALVCCLGWYLLQVNGYHPVASVLLTLGIISIGIWSAGMAEREWGKDSQKIVIDEVAGMCVSLLWVPVRIPYLLAAWLLFRFFDIVKPLLIRRMESLPGGWGVMSDDLLAGLYANIILQIMIVIVKECSLF